jgi:dTDP-4-amino-4,6-dideoxygalactose transaminase
MKKINILDLTKQLQSIQRRIDKKISEVTASQRFILGQETERFERNFSKYCGKKYAVGLGSGTDALFVALSIMGLKREDEVIIPVYTFIATAEAVTLLGGRVVFCDVDPHTGLIEANDLSKRISKATKFIIPVHLYGQLAPMNELVNVIGHRDISIIEDAAQAHGAKFRNRMAPLTQIATYSFYPAKNLGAYGDAGALVTNDRSLYEKALLFRNHGQRKGEKYYHRSIGFNFRMDEIQAAVLNAKLPYLNGWVKKRRALAQLYDLHLRKLRGVRPLTTLEHNYHAYHLYCVQVNKREALMNFLQRKGIETRIHYPTPLHLQPAYKYLGYSKDEFPGAERLSREILSLPLYPELTNTEVLKVIRMIQTFFKHQ